MSEPALILFPPTRVAKGSCRNCGRKVHPRALSHHRPIVRTVRFADGTERPVLGGGNNWCDGSPAGVRRQRDYERQRRVVCDLRDVADQAASMLLAGRGPEAETFARRCLAALKGVGARPRAREAR